MQIEKSVKNKIIKVVIIILCLVVVYIAFKIVPFLIMKTEISGKGKYDITIKCDVEKSVDEYIPYLSFLGVDARDLKIDIEKDGDIYHGLCYVNNQDVPVLEFYQHGDKFLVNLSTIISYIGLASEGMLQDKLTSLMEINKDMFITTEALEELVGKKDEDVENSVIKLIDIKRIPKICLINDNKYLNDSVRVGVDCRINSFTNIRVTARPVFPCGKRVAYGSLDGDTKIGDYCISYKKNSKIKLKMPDKEISKTEVIVEKQAAKVVLEYAKKINDKK